MKQILDNSVLMRNIKTILQLLISIAIPIIAYGFFEDFEYDLIFEINIGLVALALIYGNYNIGKDASTRAKEDVIDNHKEEYEKWIKETKKQDISNNNIYKTILDIRNSNLKIKDFKLAGEWVTNYNKEQVEILQKEKRLHLERKYAYKSVNGFRKQKYKKKLKNLPDASKMKFKYKNIKLNDIITFEYERNKNEKSILNYDPVKSRSRKRLLTSSFSQIIIALSVAVPLVFREDNITIVAMIVFVFLVLVSYLLTFVFDYLFTIRDTKYIYVNTLTRKLDKLQAINYYIERKMNAQENVSES